MQEKIDYLVFNSVNFGALGFTLINIESVLTIAVLITALIYNIKKITKKDD